MGQAIGAKAVDLGAFYGFVLCRDALTNERFARVHLPGPQPVQIIHVAIVVDGHGRRIADEDSGTAPQSYIDEPMAQVIAKSETPENCWTVFDHRVWETAGRAGRPDGNNIPMNPGLLECGGTLVVADSIAELARSAGLPEDELVRTVKEFNRFCRDGTPIDPPRGGSPGPIETGSFYAVPLIAAITYTMGGLLINGRAQVLDQDENPVPGLYAAGGAMGGLQGGPHSGYSGGWSEASTFGMLAAENAVAPVGADALSTVS
jgi:fumarate reductase flavoprotein subunit